MVEQYINQNSIKYEVAIEALGDKRQKIMQMIEAEKKASSSSEPLINFGNALLLALDDLQSYIKPEHLNAIEQILNKENFPLK